MARRKPPVPPDELATLWYHPSYGALLRPGREPPGRARRDADWQEITTIRVATVAGLLVPPPGQRLPRGFLWADPARQKYGWGDPAYVYAPLHRRCRDCGCDFVFPAKAQQHLYETLGALRDVAATRCQPCARRYRTLERRRVAYAAALHAAEDAPSAATHLAVARAAIAVLEAGGQVPIDRMIGHARRARTLRARAADTVEAQLIELRAARRAERPLKR
jgi:hypothetical protein